MSTTSSTGTDSIICHLDSELLKVSGSDNSKFLQGQLTCNVTGMTDGSSQKGAYCNIKGRVIADFLLFRTGEDLYLQTAAGMADVLQQALARFIVFFKAEISRVNNFTHQGVIASNCDQLQAALGETASDCIVIRHQNCPNQMEVICLDSIDQSMPAALTGLAVSADTQAWQLAEIERGVVHVTPALSGEHTPQELNYDLNGVIDFKKGCFPGQEVVARMHYRGKAKKRACLLVAEETAADWLNWLTAPFPVTGISLSDSNGQTSSATLLAICPWRQGFKSLWVSNGEFDQTSLTLQSQDMTDIQKVRLQPLNYQNSST